MNLLQVGILGCGDFANKHAQIVLDLKDEAQLVAFCDRNEWKAQAFQQKYAPGAAVFTDHHALFDRARLDMVIVVLPPYGHSDEVQRAAEHGVHILMEKPIALTSDHAWQMVEATEKAGIKTQVGFMFRFGEAIEQFKAMQAAGQTGAIGLMTARYFCNALHASWWRMRDRSGGQVVEQVIHMFDLLRYLVGDPVSVYSRQENLFHRDVPNYTIEDVSATIVGFNHGGLGVVYATNNAIPGRWINDYRVVAQYLVADFQNANNASFTQTNQSGNPVLTVESTKDFRRSLTLNLIQAIRTGGETRAPMREGAKSLDLVLAARRSAETRTEVTL
ncbi:MAG: Gfo/Idh/MocA family oxidoreductase [Chloroflexi bacterium]|nr:Gfo/Idh/MocA family oxidoreductase [Chloroflexota bacterium]